MKKSKLKKTNAIWIVCLLLLSQITMAQDSWKPGDPLTVKFGQGDSSFSITPWARVKFALTASDGEIYLNDPGTRVGLKLRQPCNNKFALFGHIELSMKMMSTGDGYSLTPGDATNSAGYYDAATTGADKVFGLRQTYFGMDFFKYGRLTIGKQQSEFLDISDRTDISDWNSGFASYAYSPEGSDGGLTGTGRANSAIAYRNDFAKRIHFAAMVQLNINKQADSLNSNINSAGVSAIVDIANGFDIAVGYHQVFFNDNYFDPDIIYGLEANPSYFIIGAQYKNQDLKIAVNYTMQQHGDFTKSNFTDTMGNSYDVTTVYSGSGLEAVAEYKYKKWKFQAGLNLKTPEQDENKVLNEDFGKQIIFYGVRYSPVKNITVIFEGRYENSKNASGNDIPSVNMIGLRIDI